MCLSSTSRSGRGRTEPPAVTPLKRPRSRLFGARRNSMDHCRSTHLVRSRWLALGLGLLLSWLPLAAPAAEDYSEAERLIFSNEQLRNVKPPATLGYAFRKSGALEDGYADRVSIALEPQADGSCCIGRGEFLSGARRLTLPEIENASANPVILYFLEHDVREMQRLTRGQQAHFRRMIRMAIYKGAQVTETTLRYRGRALRGHEVAIAPYLDDPVRARFEKFARKRYVFLLSDEVPGSVYGIRSSIGAENVDAPPLIVEELFIDGAEPAAGPRS